MQIQAQEIRDKAFIASENLKKIGKMLAAFSRFPSAYFKNYLDIFFIKEVLSSKEPFLEFFPKFIPETAVLFIK